MSIKVVREPANAKVDIVLVHDLLGDQAPWTSEAGLFWPEKLLSAMAADACILSFEYEAQIPSFFDKGDLDDISGELINELIYHRSDRNKALVRAAKHDENKNIITCVRGILLLGTPHFKDASLAAAAKYFQLANVADGEIPSESDLKDKSQQLITIPPDFACLKHNGAEFQVEEFYAGVKTRLGEKDVKIVDEDLAQCPGAPPPERLVRTQSRLSQYDTADDKDFKKLFRVIDRWMKKIVVPEEDKGAQNMYSAYFSGHDNHGFQIGQNPGTIKGFNFGIS